MNFKDLALRFVLGGTAVVLSYLASVILPWKLLGGIFATFPAVMIVAVLMVGLSQGSVRASEIARGSVYGMAGCTVCVLSLLLFLHLTGIWWLSLVLGLINWYISAYLLFKLRERLQAKSIHS